MSLVYPQKWCGQSQPHDTHVWAEQQGITGIWMSCAGHLGEQTPSFVPYKSCNRFTDHDGHWWADQSGTYPCPGKHAQVTSIIKGE